jgi:hypothetical protein
MSRYDSTHFLIFGALCILLSSDLGLVVRKKRPIESEIEYLLLP